MGPEREAADCEAVSKSTVLFSGGRDSSLAACLEANAGHDLRLLTAVTGGTIPTGIADYRYRELVDAFPDRTIEWAKRPCHGLFRRIAFADIERDFATYRTNLILLGHQLAIQTEAIVDCAHRGITRVVSGFV